MMKEKLRIETYMKNRVTYLDLAKGIGIILVVLGHMENISSELRIWISSFHMPLFFVISGMLLALKGADKPIINDVKSGDEMKIFVVKTAKGLLVPYLWFSLIYIPIDIMNLFIHNVDTHTFIQNILDSLTFSGVSVMWFLPALFLAEIVAMFIISRARKYPLMIVFSLSLSVISYVIWTNIKLLYDAYSSIYFFATTLGFVRVFLRSITLSVHVVIGFLMYKLIEYAKDKWIKDNDNRVRGFDIAAGVILFAVNMGLCLKNGAVDNHFLTLNNLFLYYLCAFIGSMAIILICKGINSIPFIEYFGKNSLIIMATHLQCYILYAGILIAIAIDAYVTRAKSYVYMFNSVVFTMLIEVAIITVINRFFPFITGKGSIKELFKK